MTITAREGTNSTSQTVTVDGGSNRILVAAISQYRSPNNLTASATLNGVAGTYAKFLDTTTVSTLLVLGLVYWLEADLPAAGSYTLAFTGTSTGNKVAYINTDGMAQSAPESTYEIEEGSASTSHTSALSSVSTGALVVMVAGTGTQSLSTYTNGTGLYSLPSSDRLGASYRNDGTSLTISGASVAGAVIAASFAPTSGSSLDPIVMRWQQ